MDELLEVLELEELLDVDDVEPEVLLEVDDGELVDADELVLWAVDVGWLAADEAAGWEAGPGATERAASKTTSAQSVKVHSGLLPRLWQAETRSDARGTLTSGGRRRVISGRISGGIISRGRGRRRLGFRGNREELRRAESSLQPAMHAAHLHIEVLEHFGLGGRSERATRGEKNVSFPREVSRPAQGDTEGTERG